MASTTCRGLTLDLKGAMTSLLAVLATLRQVEIKVFHFASVLVTNLIPVRQGRSSSRPAGGAEAPEAL